MMVIVKKWHKKIMIKPEKQNFIVNLVIKLNKFLMIN